MKWKFCLVFCALSLLSLPAFSESETELTVPELELAVPELEPEAEYIITGQEAMDLFQKINDLLELRNKCINSALEALTFLESELEIPETELEPEAEYIMTGQDIMYLYQKINDLLELRNEFMNWKLEALTFLESETELTVPELEPEAEYTMTGQSIMDLYQSINDLYQSINDLLELRNEWKNLAEEAQQTACERYECISSRIRKRELETTTSE